MKVLLDRVLLDVNPCLSWLHILFSSPFLPAAHPLFSSALFHGLLCETGSFSYSHNYCSPQSSALSPLKSAPPAQPTKLRSQHCPQGPLCCVLFLSWLIWSPALPVGLFWLIFSLICLLLEFHAVWFSGAFGCLLISDWLLSSFWLCEEPQGLYLHLHLGQNSLTILCISLLSVVVSPLSFLVLFIWPSPFFFLDESA